MYKVRVEQEIITNQNNNKIFICILIALIKYIVYSKKEEKKLNLKMYFYNTISKFRLLNYNNKINIF